MELDQLISEKCVQAFQELYGAGIDQDQVQVQETRKEFNGDRTVVVFPLLRHSRKKPEETAGDLGQYLAENMGEIESYEVVKGFLNLAVHPTFWARFLQEESGKKKVEIFKNEDPKRVMVEYSSPNTNKPLHLGHIRNNLLGYAMAEIMKARGNEVVKANLINDRGIHICKSMVAWLRFGDGETPGSAGEKGDHFVGRYYVLFDKMYRREVDTMTHQGEDPEKARKNAPLMKEAQELLLKWEEGDPKVREIWEMMNGWVYEGFEKTYSRMGVDFDKYYHESDTYLLGKEIITEGLNMGVFFKKDDGSVWIDLKDEGLDEKLLLRSDGTAVYMTQDLGTAELKYDDFRIDRSIYVVGNEQDYHFKVLKLILQKLNKPYADGIYHLSYGMVDLPTGRMKSREGTVVDADDLMDEMTATARRHSTDSGKLEGLGEEEKASLFDILGMGALKFYILKTDPKKRMLFNPEESIDFQGHTGPFVQYTHARIQSVLRKAGNEGIMPHDTRMDQIDDMSAVEKELLHIMYYYNDVVAEAEKNYSPALLANFAFNIAKSYNKFYHELPILREEEERKRQFRLVLSQVVARHIRSSMNLLGIRVPDRM